MVGAQEEHGTDDSWVHLLAVLCLLVFLGAVSNSARLSSQQLFAALLLGAALGAFALLAALDRLVGAAASSASARLVLSGAFAVGAYAAKTSASDNGELNLRNRPGRAAHDRSGDYCCYPDSLVSVSGCCNCWCLGVPHARERFRWQDTRQQDRDLSAWPLSSSGVVDLCGSALVGGSPAKGRPIASARIPYCAPDGFFGKVRMCWFRPGATRRSFSWPRPAASTFCPKNRRSAPTLRALLRTNATSGDSRAICRFGVSAERGARPKSRLARQVRRRPPRPNQVPGTGRYRARSKASRNCWMLGISAGTLCSHSEARSWGGAIAFSTSLNASEKKFV